MSVVKVSKYRAQHYGERLNIDIFSGLDERAELTPILMPMDDHGKPVIKQKEETVDYYYSRIDYFDKSNHVTASRHIYLILPGCHNRAAYLPHEGRHKIFEIHKGFGYLMLSGPLTDDDDGLQTSIYELNPDVTPAITIPPNNFYVFEAVDWLHEPLVISELITGNELLSKRPKQITLITGEEVLITENGRIGIPEDFVSYNFS